MNNEYAVSILVSQQISEDHWQVIRKTLKVNSNTAFATIEQWYRKHLPLGEIHFEVNQLETT